MVMVMRPSRASLPSHQSYTLVDVEPKEEHGTILAYSYEKTSCSSRSFLASVLKKAVAAASVLALVVFVLVWNRLFAVDVGSVLVESRDSSSIEKTFTVR